MVVVVQLAEQGKSLLPSGVNISDLTVLVRSRNRMGYYDAPLQAKLFWWGKRYQFVPYVFAPGGPEEADERAPVQDARARRETQASMTSDRGRRMTRRVAGPAARCARAGLGREAHRPRLRPRPGHSAVPEREVG